MKINRIVLVTATLWIGAVAVSLAASAQMGTWKLNENKSQFSSKARTNLVTYSVAKGDMVKVDVEGVDRDSKPIHWSWIGKFDGKSYKVKHNPIAEMASYKMIDDRTNEITMTKDGKTVAMTRVKVAKDGKSRTVTTTFMDGGGKNMTDKSFYDKQ